MLPPTEGMHHMPLAYSTEPSLLPIERPRCPMCQGRMMLARIEPGPAHSDLRTFECPKCEHVEKRLVEDPMNSAKPGWQNSRLQPPQ
jgi:hypothetical protein